MMTGAGIFDFGDTLSGYIEADTDLINLMRLQEEFRGTFGRAVVNHVHDPNRAVLPAFGPDSVCLPKGKRPMLALRNTTGKKLNNCLVSARFVIDQNSMDKFEKKTRQERQLKTTFTTALVQNLSALKNMSAKFATVRTDQAVNVFLPVWRENAELDVYLSNNFKYYLENPQLAEITIASDEGVQTLKYNAAELRALIK